MTNVTEAAYRERVIQKMKAVGLLKRANKKMYSKLMTSIREQFSFKIDVYPATLNDAYDLLVSHCKEVRPNKNGKDKGNRDRVRNEGPGGEDSGSENEVNGLQYAQNEEPIPGRDGIMHQNIKCFNCNRKGHYADQCPFIEVENQHNQVEEEVTSEPEVEHGTQQFITAQENDVEAEESSGNVEYAFEFCFPQVEQGCDKNAILIDTGSTCSVFNNRNMVLNIRKSKRVLRAKTNGGYQDTTHMADLPGFFPVWFNEESMLNILSFADVRNKFRITMDSGKEPTFIVHLPNNKILKFREVASGLYLYDHADGSYLQSKEVDDFTFLNQSSTGLHNFSRTEVLRAEEARGLHERLGYKSYTRFFKMLKNKEIDGCPLDVEDAKRAIYLFGKSDAMIRGKSVSRKSSRIKEVDMIRLPEQLEGKEVNLLVDFLFVYGIPFLHTISKDINFRTIEAFPHKSKANKADMIAGITRVCKMYEARGLKVKQINGDNEFQCIREDIRPIFF